jgi:hypothetical protein
MDTRKRFTSAASALIFAMALVLAASATSFAQGRGYGRGRGRGPDLFKKCGKFVNCHDARDGRVDGRDRNRRAGLWRNRGDYPRGTRVGNRSYNTNDYWRRRHLMNRRDRNVLNRREWNENWRYRTTRRRY